MSGVMLSYRQIDPVKLKCKIDLKQLFPATNKRERERFEKKWEAFLESDQYNRDIFKREGDYLIYKSEQLIPTKVDMVETFNYLIGITVRYIDYIQGFCVVDGTSPLDERVLIIWRNTKEKSNKDLEKFFRKLKYSTRDMEFNLIYVKGDNNLENIRRPE